MKELICIVCPNGCRLSVEEKNGEVIVTGNKCRRGLAFAESEIRNPMRTICSTIKTVYSDVPVIPVRVSGEIPKSRIFDVMEEINKICITSPVKRGDVVIPDVLGLGVDVIATSSILIK